MFWLEIFGAVALLLWGLRMVRTGIMGTFGPVLRKAARATDGQTLKPLVVGCVIAMLLQSSAATAMIAAGFSAQAIIGQITAFLVIIGADIGTAIASLIVSQKMPFVSPVLLSLGVFSYLIFDDQKWRGLSSAIAGLGLILLALTMIGQTSANMAQQPEFVSVIKVLSAYPMIMLLAGLILSYLAHSSLAMVLFSAGLAASGVIEPLSAIYFVLGANIGSGLLPFIANLKSRKGARVPVTANLVLRTFIALLAYFLLPWISNTGVFQIASMVPPAIVAHLLLNLAVGIAGVILMKPLLHWVDSNAQADPFDPNHLVPQHLDETVLNHPAQALACARREALVMAEVAKSMVQDALPLLRDDTHGVRNDIETREDSLDRLFNAIKSYLADVLQQQLSKREINKAMDLLAFVTNMEHVGDIVERNLIGLSLKKNALHAQFSNDGLVEIERLHSAVLENFDLTINVFMSGEPELARQLYEAKADIRKIEHKSIVTHIERLGSGISESVATSELHLDILRDLKRINSHLTSTAYPVLMSSGEVPKTKWRRR